LSIWRGPLTGRAGFRPTLGTTPGRNAIHDRDDQLGYTYPGRVTRTPSRALPARRQRGVPQPWLVWRLPETGLGHLHRLASPARTPAGRILPPPRIAHGLGQVIPRVVCERPARRPLLRRQRHLWHQRHRPLVSARARRRNP